jgi:hypothetical protein
VASGRIAEQGFASLELSGIRTCSSGSIYEKPKLSKNVILKIDIEEPGIFPQIELFPEAIDLDRLHICASAQHSQQFRSRCAVFNMAGQPMRRTNGQQNGAGFGCLRMPGDNFGG